MRIIFGRELSSPTGPLGLCGASRRLKKLFLCCFLFCFFSFALYFVSFFLLCSRWTGLRGTTGRVEVFPKSISSTCRPVSLMVCNNAFYLQLSSRVFVSSSHNTDCCTPVNLDLESCIIRIIMVLHAILFCTLHFTLLFLLIFTILNVQRELSAKDITRAKTATLR